MVTPNFSIVKFRQREATRPTKERSHLQLISAHIVGMIMVGTCFGHFGLITQRTVQSDNISDNEKEPRKNDTPLVR